MEAENKKRTSQFGVRDVLLLTTGCAYALAILIPAASREPNGAAIIIAIVSGMTMLGSAISYPIHRFWLRKRLTVLAVNHLAYFLALIISASLWDAEILRAAPILAGGPLSFLGVTHQWSARILVIVGLALPIIALMSAHTFRANLVGVVLTSLGVALWYLSAFGAGIARMP